MLDQTPSTEDANQVCSNLQIGIDFSQKCSHIILKIELNELDETCRIAKEFIKLYYDIIDKKRRVSY